MSAEAVQVAQTRWRHITVSIAAVCAILLFSSLSGSPAVAGTAIYYSAAGNAYGWCAGYSAGRARRCAERYCVNGGGTQCKLAVECGGGWGAIAYLQGSVKAFGASCGLSDSAAARRLALSWCVGASNTLCWTSDTFSGHGRKSSAESNRTFDRIFYAQGMLELLSYKIGPADGTMGSRTRDAVKRFQTSIGVEPNGVIDEKLYGRLLESIGGAQPLVKALKQDYLQKKTDEKIVEHTYGYAPPPPKPPKAK